MSSVTKIQYPPEFLSVLEHKHLLLDTSVFIDTALHPSVFIDFFNILRKRHVTLTTCEFVRIEFIKGFSSEVKLQEKIDLLNWVVDNLVLPTTVNEIQLLESLVRQYRVDGGSASLVDLMLGAMLKKYGDSLFLLTKNPSDFPLNIFNLETHCELVLRKAIQPYGVFSYSK